MDSWEDVLDGAGSLFRTGMDSWSLYNSRTNDKGSGAVYNASAGGAAAAQAPAPAPGLGSGMITLIVVGAMFVLLLLVLLLRR